MMQRRYRALRIVATVYKVFGLLVGIATVLIVIGMFAMGVFGGAAGHGMGQGGAAFPLMTGIFGGVLGGLIALLYGGIVAVTLYAIGEAIYLLLALEENTREAAAAVKALGATPGGAAAPQGPPQGPPPGGAPSQA